MGTPYRATVPSHGFGGWEMGAMAWCAQRGVAKSGSERGHLAAMDRRAPREGARRPQLWLREKAGEEGVELTCVCGLKY